MRKEDMLVPDVGAPGVLAAKADSVK
jgi:hypothetical protein